MSRRDRYLADLRSQLEWLRQRRAEHPSQSAEILPSEAAILRAIERIESEGVVEQVRDLSAPGIDDRIEVIQARCQRLDQEDSPCPES